MFKARWRGACGLDQYGGSVGGMVVVSRVVGVHDVGDAGGLVSRVLALIPSRSGTKKYSSGSKKKKF